MYKVFYRFVAFALVISITFASVSQEIAQASTNQNNQIQTELNKDSNYKGSNSKTALGSFSDILYKWYEKLEKDVNNNNQNQFNSDLQNAINEFKKIRSSIDQELLENRQTLQNLNAKSALERQTKFQSELESKLDNFGKLFESIEKISSGLNELKSNSDLKGKLDSFANLLEKEKSQQPLGVMPHNNVKLTPSKPTTGSSVSAAYLGNKSVGTDTGLPKTPTSDDLSETEEIKFTDEIKQLADSLNSSVKIYEYVRNNVNYEPYYGSRKGAVGTLQQMSGNDYDQASLLISMLRYKGIASRYVRGTVDVPIEKVKGWTGAETAETAVNAISSLGIPSTCIVSGGVISAVEMEHVWVEAYVPYSNYRGAGTGTGKKIWVPLDPSFKQSTKRNGLNSESVTGISNQDIQNTLKDSGVVSSDRDAVSRIGTDAIQQKLTQQKNALESYLNKNNMNSATWADVFGGYEIIVQKLGLLPLTLPYKTISVFGEYESIDNTYKDSITFSIRGADPYGQNFSGANDFEYTVNASELNSKKITLSWVAATSEDEAVIEKYGSIFKTPAYLVQLKPVLKVDGKVVATGKAVGMGYNQQFTIGFKSAGQSQTENVVNTVIAGSYYCVGLDNGTISSDELNSITNKLKAQESSVNEQNIYSDEAMGEILNEAVKTYFGQLDVYDRILAAQYGVKSTRLISEGMTGYNVKVSYTFNCPVEISEGSMYIDVDRDVNSVVSLKGDTNAEKSYMLASGIFSSSMEHEIFEQMFNIPSVSTIKILTAANSMGIPVYTVKKDNISAVLPKLEVSDSVKTDITNAIGAGKEVTIPQRNIQYFNWNGTGYVVLDPSTGAAAYMISGGTAGGSMSIDQMLSDYIEGVIEGLIFTLAVQTLEMVAAMLVPGSAIVAGAFTILYATMLVCFITDISVLAIEYISTGDEYYLDELIVQLAACATIGIMCKPFTKISENLKMLKEIKVKQDAFFEHNKSNGFSDDVSTEFWQKYGSDNISKAQDTLDALKNQNVSNENVSRAGSSLDANGIETFKNIVEDNAGKFTDADHAEVLDLLEKCSDKDESDGLRNEIDALRNERKPSEFKPNEIDTLEEVKGAAKAEEAIQSTSDTEAISEGKTDSTESEEKAVNRPTWRQSEIDIFAADYTETEGYTDQAVFIKDANGNVIPGKYGQTGSIRIDIYKTDHIVEVKNYDVTSARGRSNLVENIRKQYWQRKSFFPDTKQTYVIDTRGQNTSLDTLNQLQNSIYNNTEISIDIQIKK